MWAKSDAHPGESYLAAKTAAPWYKQLACSQYSTRRATPFTPN